MKYEDLSGKAKKIVDFVNSESYSPRVDRECGDIIVFKEKHGNIYYKFSTIKDVQSASLDVLKNRIDWFYKLEEPTTDIVGSDIKKLPESLQEEAVRKLKTFRRRLDLIKEENDMYDLAHYALEDQNGFLAWWIIRNRQDYEYEGFSIESIEIV